MKKIIVFIVILFIAMIHSIAAHDLIILRNGSIIDANVLEISPTEIRYRRLDHLDGPVIVIFISEVLTIRYQNGTTQVFGNAPPSQTPRTQTPATPPRDTTSIINPNKFIFGVSANAGGAMAMEFGSTPGLRFEFGIGNFNADLFLGGGYYGFNSLTTFNYFWHSSIGGFYLGAGIGLTIREYEYYWYDEDNKEHWDWDIGPFFQFGLNIGYKFVTRSGIYFRTGTFIGGAFGETIFFVFNPDISLGWTMR